MKNSNKVIQKRREQIIKILQSIESSTISELSDKLSVSEMTIRRDCTVLSSMGLIEQTFGKISILPENDEANNDITALHSIRNKIAQKAANFIENGQIIFINTSATAIQIIKFLTDKTFIILTNNLKALEFTYNPESTLFLAGGEVRTPKKALVGDLAFNSFHTMRADVGIIGCTGLDSEMGISTSQIHEARINREIIKNSAKLILVADYRKIGTPSNFSIGNFDDIDLLITDSFANEETLRLLRKRGVEVIQVPI
ncbi:MAG: DeoR/GlpR family DNA-binding transcription regulator [Ligilactobacillus agilis]|uniref:DeoR/GlpR family DNA-binding transcription regulator n=1 Tax=Ligilactobacillus agilis TaxID=1601 RepID=UPI002432E499|nr:DeoR/GlpR family DNA-binding transcription regulator [Ligilactobacillus agilis]MCI5760872.1 DeoR/GlpR family DNA-binding transcription regulator [Ligilactobacillus agilis]MDY4065058.1 DeoR/GlpR family DNA-binding transcription regulator [Ligilactobacillus agilis]